MEDDMGEAADRLQHVVTAGPQHACSPMKVHEFEKDDDSNGHIDFITAASVNILYTYLAFIHC